MKKRTYKTYWNQYRDIRQRLFNPNNKSYHIMKHLEFGFSNYRDFHDYMEADLGARPTPEHHLTRIDWQKGFIPGNLTWQRHQEIIVRVPGMRKILFRKRLYTISEFADLVGATFHQVYYCHRKGMTAQQIWNKYNEKNRTTAKSRSERSQ